MALIFGGSAMADDSKKDNDDQDKPKPEKPAKDSCDCNCKTVVDYIEIPDGKGGTKKQRVTYKDCS